jgi:hypothetical protein
MEVNGQLRSPATSPPGEKPPGTYGTGGWVGPKAGLDVVSKRIPAPAGNWTPVTQPVA